MNQAKHIILLFLATATLAGAASTAELVASKEPGWPQWRGPRRDGVSDEKGLLKSWPEGGPKLLWKANGIGKGHSSPAISCGSIYITGDEGDKLNVYALDLEGNPRWKSENGECWKKNFPGSRTGCSYSDGMVYQMNAHGRLACLDAGSGAEVWNVQILDKYASRNINWGISESPLVLDGKVYVTPAGQDALMVALDARSGREIWKTAPLENEMPTYSSALMTDTGSGRQLISGGSAHIFGVDAATGRMLWKYRHEIDKPVMLSPSFYQGDVMVSISSRDRKMNYALSLDAGNNTVAKKWQHDIGNLYGSVVCVDGNILCSSLTKPVGLVCIDASSGRIKCRQEAPSDASSIYADGRFYTLCSSGKMLMLKVGENELTTVSGFDFMTGKKNVWAHPVICDGRLYLRYDDTLYCYDVKNP